MGAPALPDPVAWAVPVFFGTMLLEMVLSRRGPSAYETRDTVTSLALGVGYLVTAALFGPALLGAMEALGRFAPFRFADQPWGWHPAVFALCYVLDDFRFYWYHRAAHEVRWFWAAHVTHHSSQHYNLSTALRQPWVFHLTGGFVFSFPLVLLGFDPAMLAFCGALNLVYQYGIHTEHIRRLPRPVEWLMNTPSHHRAHHATNPRYLDCNYAGTFVLWDRLFGTFVPELDTDRPRYGLVHQLGTFRPWRAAVHELEAVLREASAPGLRLGQRLRVAWGPPGGGPDGTGPTSARIKAAHVAAHPEDAGTPGLPAAPGA
jgi:sterol desaturase/sphingolipid hydroxylase (fatty acid hydroxylase superfamily)